MNRRTFLASAAATAIAPSCPAKPARFFAGAVPPGTLVTVPNMIFAMGCGEPRIVRWSDAQDPAVWDTAFRQFQDSIHLASVPGGVRR